MENLTIGFLGAGKMASALASGFVRAGITAKENIIASDVSALARSAFSETVGAKSTERNSEIASFASVLIVAVKPDQVSGVLREIAPQLKHHHLIVSIAAGITLQKLQSHLQPDA